MPARVHAILVVRPDGRTPAALHLRRTIAALDAQTKRADSLTIVLCGGDDVVAQSAGEVAGAEIVRMPGSTGFAAAAARGVGDTDADALWLLAQDTAPEPEALARLVGALELAPSVAVAAPKLVRWNDRTEIVSLGVTMTQLGRTVGLADGQLDQGQHDGRDDVLGSDVRAVLVRTGAWRELDGLDPALAGADQGLDLGVRARLAGARVSIVPSAIVATAGDGVAGLPAPLSAARRQRAAYASRLAQLHRRMVYTPVFAAPLLWLSILPLVLWRTVLLLFRKQPALISPEWAASFVAFGRPAAVVRSRRRLSSAKRVPWAQLAPLRVTPSQLRESLGTDDEVEPLTGPARSDLRFFSGGGAWLVLAALLVSVLAFPALLAWPVIGGGALQPLRSTVAQLWADAAYGERGLGLDTVGAADPFASVIALLGSFAPWSPSQAVVVLWILALPLAALGGWFAATRVTEKSVLRISGGVVWALAPTFVIALTQGRPAAVIAHLLLPWLFYAGSVAHRSWAGAGAASLLLVGVVAAAPSLAPAFVVLWVAVMLMLVVMRAGRGVFGIVWVLVPTVAMFAPLIWHAVAIGDGWVLLADPGLPWAGPQVDADAAGRALLAAGIPTSDFAGWTGMLPEGWVWWVPLLAAPAALLALAAPLTQRWAAGIVMLAVSALGLATAFAAVGLSISFTQSLPVALWPGSALSLAWLGVLGGALVVLDAGLAPRLRLARGIGATVLCVTITVLAVPSLTAVARDVAFITNGPVSTLPAYIAAEGRDDPDIGTIILTPQNSGGLSTRFVWGGSETIGSQATIIATRTDAVPADDEIAALAADLVTSSSAAPIEELAGQGIGFVLLAPAAGAESTAARTLRLSATTSLDQRDSLEAVGETAKGELWRIVVDVDRRPDISTDQQAISALIAFGQLAIVGISILLALPTAATRRASRRASRVVGPYWQEGR